MVADPWLLRMGNQVSTNLKHALLLEGSKKHGTRKNPNSPRSETIGILSFEVANVMSKTVHLHKSLTSAEISKLKTEILKSHGVNTLVSSDDTYLLELALFEKFEDLNRVSAAVSRLGKKCTVPALQGFEHVFSDIVNGVIDVRELGFLVKDMDAMVKKMERYINYTATLYTEMEVLNELESAIKKFQQNQHEESRKVFEHKLFWQKQDVRHLQDVSLWNRTYDKVVELLARTVCTIYAKICLVFSDTISRRQFFSPSGSVSVSSNAQLLHSPRSLLSHKSSAQMDIANANNLVKFTSSSNCGSVSSTTSGSNMGKKGVRDFKPHNEIPLFRAEDFNFACGMGPGRLFMECLSMGSSVSKFDDNDNFVRDPDDGGSQFSGCCSVSSTVKREMQSHSGFPSDWSQCGVPTSRDHQRRFLHGHLSSTNKSKNKTAQKSSLMAQAAPTTVGGSALALHYANVIIVIEKLLCYPHLVGEEARDDLYQMLPTSLRLSLKTSLKSYGKDLGIYDAPLAHDWKDRLDETLRWLAPLAHNMIRWQSERNFEQQQIVLRTNVLLLQTLYFADRAKTETAICELLVGLNYICRYEQQQNALLDCASSFDFDDCMDWQLQY